MTEQDIFSVEQQEASERFALMQRAAEMAGNVTVVQIAEPGETIFVGAHSGYVYVERHDESPKTVYIETPAANVRVTEGNIGFRITAINPPNTNEFYRILDELVETKS